MSAYFRIVTDVTGQIDFNPRRVKLIVSDNLATVTTAGYLNVANLEGFAIYPTDIIDLIYSYNTTLRSGTYAVCTVAISNGVITLSTWTSPGDVLLPVVNNHLAVFSGTTGTIADPSGTAIHGGGLQAGLSGTAGTLTSYPATSSKGSLIVAAVANTGNTATTISNVAMGQASVVSIPDPGTATANFAVAPAALVNGNLVEASGTAGLVADAGVAVSAVQLKANIHGVKSANIGGGGTSPVTVTVSGMTSSSVVIAQTVSSTNAGPVYALAPTAGSGSFTITPSTDPGASWIINYVVFIAAQ